MYEDSDLYKLVFENAKLQTFKAIIILVHSCYLDEQLAIYSQEIFLVGCLCMIIIVRSMVIIHCHNNLTYEHR